MAFHAYAAGYAAGHRLQNALFYAVVYRLCACELLELGMRPARGRVEDAGGSIDACVPQQASRPSPESAGRSGVLRAPPVA